MLSASDPVSRLFEIVRDRRAGNDLGPTRYHRQRWLGDPGRELDFSRNDGILIKASPRGPRTSTRQPRRSGACLFF